MLLTPLPTQGRDGAHVCTIQVYRPAAPPPAGVNRPRSPEISTVKLRLCFAESKGPTSSLGGHLACISDEIQTRAWQVRVVCHRSGKGQTFEA